jgi:ribosomal protein S18 acetylase RimI-like enzyme
MTTFVERAPRTNEARLISTIVKAFLADPAARWMYPDVNQYLLHFPDFVRAFAGKAFEYRTAEVVSGFDCAALWLPPLVQPEDATILEVIQRTVAAELLPDVMNVFEQMGRFHPEEAHWYLPLIGVGPADQGRGCGSALLRRSLARCDRDQFPAYLEATNPRNTTLYERFGFKPVGRIQAGSSPEIIPMLRPPA